MLYSIDSDTCALSLPPGCLNHSTEGEVPDEVPGAVCQTNTICRLAVSRPGNLRHEIIHQDLHFGSAYLIGLWASLSGVSCPSSWRLTLDIPCSWPLSSSGKARQSSGHTFCTHASQNHNLIDVSLRNCIMPPLVHKMSQADLRWELLISISASYTLMLFHFDTCREADAEDLKHASQANSRSHGTLDSAAAACAYMRMLTEGDLIDWSGDDSAPESTQKTPDVLKTCASARYSLRICME